jgi:hypothetical protein
MLGPRGAEPVDARPRSALTLFGRAPRLAVADGGFASRTNERAARDRGVRHVVLPRQPRERSIVSSPGSPCAGAPAARADQCTQTVSWPPAVSVPRRHRNAALGRAGRNRQQSVGARSSDTMSGSEPTLAVTGQQAGEMNDQSRAPNHRPPSWAYRNRHFCTGSS